MESTLAKPLLSTTEALQMLPGRGSALLRRLLAARWIKPCIGGTRPIYRAADVEGCLARLDKGEHPQAVHVWKAGIGLEGSRAVAHLVPAIGGKAACCGYKADWMSDSHASTKCTRCQNHAKSLRVEDC